MVYIQRYFCKLYYRYIIYSEWIGSSSSSGSTITDSGGDTELSDSYKDSKYGIIDYKRLTEYIDDWANSRPEGVDGKLIIIQAGKSSSGKVLKE